MKSTAPGSLLYYICLCDLFFFAFIFRSIKPKIQKYLAALYFIWHSIYQFITTVHVRLPISGAVTRKGLTTPLTHRVASIFYLCAGVVYVVLLGSPTGSITVNRPSNLYKEGQGTPRGGEKILRLDTTKGESAYAATPS